MAAHALACIAVRAAGFDHVSDDDFARVTIAQAFARAPKLDPSGTSWLPFPFWTMGALMAALGRSLAVARAVSIALASLAAVTPYLTLRFAGVPRGRALLATAFAFATPWALWLGAATVPESLTASLTATGVIGLSASVWRAPGLSPSVWRTPREPGPSPSVWRARRGPGFSPSVWRAHCEPVLFALAVTAACLSRYEPWPVAAVLAIVLAVAAIRSPDEAAGADTRARSRVLAIAAALAALGPLVWMAWNAHAHDGPLHFFRRVSGFKRAIGEGATDAAEAWLLYPRLLFTTRPEVVIPAIFLFPSLREPELRRRWAIPLACTLAQIALLAYGNVRDGAPAHHPERALVGATLLLALFVVDAGLTKLHELALDGRPLAAKGAAACFAVAWAISSVRAWDPPGQGPSEDRREQIARGESLRASGAEAIVVTPCAFEHFALIAAYGAPERVRVEPRTAAAPPGACPDVAVAR